MMHNVNIKYSFIYLSPLTDTYLACTIKLFFSISSMFRYVDILREYKKFFGKSTCTVILGTVMSFREVLKTINFSESTFYPQFILKCFTKCYNFSFSSPELPNLRHTCHTPAIQPLLSFLWLNNLSSI